MGWRIIEIESDENIKLYLNNLMIKRSKGKILINLAEIDTLLLKNTRTNISIRLINALSRNNINVIFMDNVHEPNSYLVPVNGNHNSLKVIEKQINWTNPYKGNLWKNVVQNKIENQLKVLNKYCLTNLNDYFKKLIGEVKSFDVTNREGHAAKVYWNNIFNKSFKRDIKCIDFPIINAMLNYGYAIIRSLVIRSIVKKGLDTRISIFHKSFSNFFALASDLMEPLRPLIDEVVFKNKDATLFTYDIKDQLIGVLESKVLINDKWYYVNKAVDICIDNIVAEKGWVWLKLWD